MSQIDQAFIRAYAPEAEQPAQLPGPEPIPSPHFRTVGGSNPTAAGNNAYSDTATMQREMQSVASNEVVSNVVGNRVSSVAPSSVRRPLSTFVEPEPAPTTSFQPVFEVDAFRWPANVNNLLAAYETLLAPVAEQLLASSEEGRSMIGIAGLRSGVGCSTVLMALSRLLAETGKSVAIVDGNFATGTLAKSLGLEFDTGWEDVLAGRVPLAESMVRSINDNVSLLPLGGHVQSPGGLLAGIQTSVSAGVLRYHYDLVLFDLGTPSQGEQLSSAKSLLEHCRIDASILVADTAATNVESDHQVAQLMSLLGSTCLGVIGNESRCHESMLS